MALTDNGRVEYEANQEAYAFAAMTQDSVDLQKFSAAFAPFSQRSGFEPVIAPYGVDTGGAIVPAASMADDEIDVGALTAKMAAATGADADGEISVAGDTLTVTRPSTQDFLIHSVTVDNTGTLVLVSGTEGAAFSETRGAAGGPPYIPVDSVEVGQVRLSSQVAAAITLADISQVTGLSRERYDYPIFSVDNANGTISFAQAPANIHTGDVPKLIYARGYSPIFAEQPRSRDWKPAENTHSVSSEQFYDGPVGSVSSSVGQASFTTLFRDGHTDQLVKLKDETLWFRWKQDRNRSPYQLTNGRVGIDRDNAPGENPRSTVTISAQDPSIDFDG